MRMVAFGCGKVLRDVVEQNYNDLPSAFKLGLLQTMLAATITSASAEPLFIDSIDNVADFLPDCSQ